MQHDSTPRPRRKTTIFLTALAYLQARLPVWHNSSPVFSIQRSKGGGVQTQATPTRTLSVPNNNHEESKVHCTRHLQSRSRKSQQIYINLAKPSQAKIL